MLGGKLLSLNRFAISYLLKTIYRQHTFPVTSCATYPAIADFSFKKTRKCMNVWTYEPIKLNVTNYAVNLKMQRQETN